MLDGVVGDESDGGEWECVSPAGEVEVFDVGGFEAEERESCGPLGLNLGGELGVCVVALEHEAGAVVWVAVVEG